VTLPDFETPRLLLRPRSMDDFDACLAMDRDPQVTRYVQGPWADPDEHRRFLTDRIRRAWPAGQGYWSIFAKAEPQTFLGWILLIPYDGIGPETNLGWRLRRAAWGKGYATEAAEACIDWAFDVLGWTEVIHTIDAANVNSTSVAKRLGSRILRQAVLPPPLNLPVVCWGQSRAEWLARRRR